jgi:hypothetical protein
MPQRPAALALVPAQAAAAYPRLLQALLLLPVLLQLLLVQLLPAQLPWLLLLLLLVPAVPQQLAATVQLLVRPSGG